MMGFVYGNQFYHFVLIVNAQTLIFNPNMFAHTIRITVRPDVCGFQRHDRRHFPRCELIRMILQNHEKTARTHSGNNVF